MSRILKTGKNQVTQKYNAITHKGIDIVKYKGQLDYIVAHTDGEVVEVVKNCNKTYRFGGSYGNYVRIKHSNGYYTLYAHMSYGSVKVSKGQKVKKGQVLGYMGNTGHSFGAHVHFEVRNTKNKRINPTPYIDADLPSSKKKYSVEYRVHCNKVWFNITSNGGTAGNLRNEIDGYQVKTFNGAGNIKYMSHIKNYGWLEHVIKWDNTDDGYSGIFGKPIDAISMWSEHGDLTYRVHYNGKWSPWVKGKYGTNKGEYAGEIGKTIDGIEIKFS